MFDSQKDKYEGVNEHYVIDSEDWFKADQCCFGATEDHFLIFCETNRNGSTENFKASLFRINFEIPYCKMS